VNHVRRILVVKLGAIGDIILTAVALTQYRARFPDVAVDWITDAGLKSLVEATGIADRVVDVDEASMVQGVLPARVYAFARSMVHVKRVCASRYDGIFTVYLDKRTKVLTWGIPAKVRRSLGDSNLGDRKRRPTYLLHRSWVHEYWRMLTGADSEAIDIAAATAALGAKMLQYVKGLADASLGTGYVVVAAGGAKNLYRDDALRRWPIQHFRELVETLLSQGRRVVLVGANSDQWVSDAMRGLPVEDIIGKTSLMQLLAVMQNASAVVANDSGVFHLATLTTRGLVGLFGPTPPNGIAPLGRANTRILAPDNRISCSPCYDGRNYAACIRNICLESTPVSAVAEAIAAVSHKYV
jgi:heptosyltransferase-2